MPMNIIDTVKVKYNFDGDNNTELTIRKDDIIDVLVKDPSGWADGIIRTKKKRGWFPMEYTRSITDSENIKLMAEKNSRENESVIKEESVGELSKQNETNEEKNKENESNENNEQNDEDEINDLNNDNDSDDMQLSSNWKKKRTINGKKYYINIETNETTYNKHRTLRRAEGLKLSRELQNLINNGGAPSKPEGPPPQPQRSTKIKNLANIIGSSLASSSYSINSDGSSPTNPIRSRPESESKLMDIGSIVHSRPTSSSYGNPSSPYTQTYNDDSESSSFTLSKQNSVSSLNGFSNINGYSMAAASMLTHSMKNLNNSSLENINEFSLMKKMSSPNLTFPQVSSPIGQPSISSTSIIERMKKIEFPKNGTGKKSNIEKHHQKLIQLIVDFINNINKNKKSSYLDQCNEIKNLLKKLLISANIINQEGVVTTYNNQANLYYSTMLSFSRVILNVRDAAGQWPPPDVNQMIYTQIDDFGCNYQLLLNSFTFSANNSGTDNNNEINISNPVINTNPSFLSNIDNYSSNTIINKINHQVTIIMMSISDLIIISRKEQTVNENIYTLAIDCRDNITVLANQIDDIHFKKRYTMKIVTQFIHKKEVLVNSIKELTITIKSSNEKFAPSNSLELILESLSNCINIIDDIVVIIRGIYDVSDSPCISQQNSFDFSESTIGLDNYEQNRKIFGDQSSVINSAFPKRLEMMLKKKDLHEVKSAIEPGNKHIRSMNEKITLNYKGQYNSEVNLFKDQDMTLRLYKVKSNPRVGSRSKINKFFGEDDADVESEKVNNSVPKPWYLEVDYPKGSITYNMEGQINGATLTAYIEYVTSHENNDPEFDQRTLLLMFDQFCTIPEFIEHLSKRYFMKPPSNLSKENVQEWRVVKQTVIQNKILGLINLWLSNYWIEDDTENLQAIIDFLTNASNPVDPTNQSYSDSAIDILFKAKKMQSGLAGTTEKDDEPKPKTESKRNSSENFPHPILPKCQDKFTFLDIDPLEFTRQMCLLVGEAYSKVHPHELMIVNKKNCKSDSIKMLTKISIRITQYIITMILSDTDPKRRNMFLKHSINICKKSFDERNFDLVFSVIAALNSSAIVRLTKTWALLPTKFKDTLEYCQNQISHNKNYQKYRHILKTCEKPCIPFFGIILKDITFTEDGNSKYRKENLINISKFHNMATIIEEYNSFKVPYRFKEVPFIQEWIRSDIIDVDEKDEQDLYDLSVKVEPKNQPTVTNES